MHECNHTPIVPFRGNLLEVAWEGISEGADFLVS